MTAQQRLLVMIVFVVAVVGGGILAFTVIGGGGLPAPSSVAGASATPPVPSATSAAISPTLTPTAAATPSATPTPKPTTAPGPVAKIVLTQLKLDAGDDPAGQNRVVTFTTGGAGEITAALSTLSPTGTTRMCLTADGKDLGCRTAAAGKLTAKTTKKAATFELTLRGSGTETPVVEVAITFPATTPAVTIANARFDGTMFPETNGIQAIVQPRANGDLHLTADWGGHPFLYEVDLVEQGGAGSQTLANQGPATRMDVKLPITAPNPWKVLLQNIETGFGATPMTATIAWP